MNTELTDVVVTELTDVVSEIREAYSDFAQESAQERALILIRSYFEAAEQEFNEQGRVSETLTGSFFSWFDSPVGRMDKDRAMERLSESYKGLQGIHSFE